MRAALAAVAGVALMACTGPLVPTGSVPVPSDPTASATPGRAMPPASAASASPTGGGTGSASPSARPSTKPEPTTKRLPLEGRTIVVDPGHNGVWTKKQLRQVPAGNGRTKACNSSGTASNAGYAEHAYTWAQANALAKELRGRGATVRLTRTDDRSSGPCVNLRSTLANTLKADALVSIHADGSLAKGARGFHVIVSTTMAGGTRTETASAKLAKRIRSALESTTPMPRSTYIGNGTALSFRNDLATLNLSRRPAVMLEMGNMRSSADAHLLASAAFRAKAASALADGITAALG